MVKSLELRLCCFLEGRCISIWLKRGFCKQLHLETYSSEPAPLPPAPSRGVTVAPAECFGGKPRALIGGGFSGKSWATVLGNNRLRVGTCPPSNDPDFFITLSRVGCDQDKSGWLPFPLEARLFHLGAADSALWINNRKTQQNHWFFGIEWW